MVLDLSMYFAVLCRILENISVFKTKKNVSEYRMSTNLGHSKSNMQSISFGR